MNETESEKMHPRASLALEEVRQDVPSPRLDWMMQTRNKIAVGTKAPRRWTFPRLAAWGAATAAAGVLAVVTVGALLPASDSGSSLQPKNAAAAVLLEAAGNVDNLSIYEENIDPTGKFIYRRVQETRRSFVFKEQSKTADPSKAEQLLVDEETVTDSWRPVDSSIVLIRYRVLARRAVNPAQQADVDAVFTNSQNGTPLGEWREISFPEMPYPQCAQVEDSNSVDPNSPTECVPGPSQENPFVNPTSSNFTKLSSNVGELETQLRTYAREVRDQIDELYTYNNGESAVPPEKRSDDEDLFFKVMNLLDSAEPVLSQELRVGLLEVLAGIDGISVKEDVEVGGVSGVAIGINIYKSPVLHEIVIDKETSRVLGHRMTEQSDAPQIKRGDGAITEVRLPKGVIGSSTQSSVLVNAVGDTQ